jgi:hypothetical protein
MEDSLFKFDLEFIVQHDRLIFKGLEDFFFLNIGLLNEEVSVFVSIEITKIY